LKVEAEADAKAIGVVVSLKSTSFSGNGRCGRKGETKREGG